MAKTRDTSSQSLKRGFTKDDARELAEILGVDAARRVTPGLKAACRRYRSDTSCDESPEIKAFISATRDFLVAWHEAPADYKGQLARMADDQDFVPSLERITPSLKRVLELHALWHTRPRGRPMDRGKRVLLVIAAQVLEDGGIRVTKARTFERVAVVLFRAISENVSDVRPYVRYAVDQHRLHKAVPPPSFSRISNLS